MTATPIPRTMAKTMLGAVELSVLATLPLGRKTVKTWVVPAQKRTGAYAWIEKTMRATGGQVFVVCPLIEESENVTAVRAVVKEAERIRKIFPNRKVGLLHGKLASAEKNRVLDAFHRKTYDILVTTPVVEVGIDVPNASVMLIEAAERFGLANLHQLRGRVGRGSAQSYCLLFTDAGDEAAVSRLKSLETVHSGPLLAEIDLKLRGPGEVFGVRQHGMPKLKIASFTDMALVDETQETLHAITKKDPDLSGFPQLQEYAKKSTILPIPKD
jgi:ATP-dependent DNA helicase RecG